MPYHVFLFASLHVGSVPGGGQPAVTAKSLYSALALKPDVFNPDPVLTGSQSPIPIPFVLRTTGYAY